eukprot:8688773-Pyramimonas_sp.AAC.1
MANALRKAACRENSSARIRIPQMTALLVAAAAPTRTPPTRGSAIFSRPPAAPWMTPCAPRGYAR